MDFRLPVRIYPLVNPHIRGNRFPTHSENFRPIVNMFPYTRFRYCNKGPTGEKDGSVAERLARMDANYNRDGMRTTVEGIMVVHHNGHPYILLLQNEALLKLPGGSLRPGENEIEGLKRKLTSKLGCTLPRHRPDWQIGECVATWRRPSFDSEFRLDPNVPDPKERKKLFIVHMAEGMHIAEPENLKLVYVPFFFISNIQNYLNG